MDVAILGGREITLPGGWERRTLVSILGGAEIDARATPGEGATLTFVSVFGGANMKVARGARVSVEGFSFLGGRKIDTSPGDGPEIKVRAYTFLGGLRVTDRE